MGLLLVLIVPCSYSWPDVVCGASRHICNPFYLSSVMYFQWEELDLSIRIVKSGLAMKSSWSREAEE